MVLCCKSNLVSDEIQGNWSCCTYGGDYFELYFQDDKYRYVTDFGLIFPWDKFQVNGDSLFQESQATNGTRNTEKSRIEIIDKNTFILHFENRKPWTFRRIESELIISEVDSINLANTKFRSLKTKCQDQRSYEERTNDSTDSYIGIKY